MRTTILITTSAALAAVFALSSASHAPAALQTIAAANDQGEMTTPPELNREDRPELEFPYRCAAVDPNQGLDSGAPASPCFLVYSAELSPDSSETPLPLSSELRAMDREILNRPTPSRRAIDPEMLNKPAPDQQAMDEEILNKPSADQKAPGPRTPDELVDELVENGEVDETGAKRAEGGPAKPTENWFGCNPDNAQAACEDSEESKERRSSAQ